MEHTAWQCPGMMAVEKTQKVIPAGEGAGQDYQTWYYQAQETLRVCQATNRSMVSGRMPR